MVTIRIAALISAFLILAIPTQSTAQIDVQDVFRIIEGVQRQHQQYQQPRPPVQAAPRTPQPGSRVLVPAPVVDEDIRQAQHILNELGYDAGPTDGLSGSRTRRALQSFQRSAGLPADGHMSHATQNALQAAWERHRAAGRQDIAAQPAAPSVSAGPGQSAYLDSDRAVVAEVQAQLTELGYDPGPVDGVYGARTGAAIAAFHRDRGMDALPHITEATVSALNNEVAGDVPLPEGSAAVLAASADSGLPAAPLSFDHAPSPTYEAFLRLFMAENHDLLDNPAFAWEHHLVFHLDQQVSASCHAAETAWRNEFERADAIESAQQLLRPVLAEAQNWPTTGIFKIVLSRREIGEYDQQAEHFPLLEAERLSWRVVRNGARRGTFGATKSLCRAGLTGSQFGQLEGAGWVPRNNFEFRVDSFDMLRRIPMPREQAAEFARTASGNGNFRSVDIELLIEVGPILVNPPPRRGLRPPTGHTSGRIVAARVVRAGTSDVVYEFPLAAEGIAAEPESPVVVVPPELAEDGQAPETPTLVTSPAEGEDRRDTGSFVAGFDEAVAPDRSLLRRMYLAAHGDVLDLHGVAYWNFLEMHTRDLGEEACEVFAGQLREIEFATPPLFDLALERFRQDIAQLGDVPENVMVRIEAEVSLGEYDFERALFPVNLGDERSDFARLSACRFIRQSDGIIHPRT